MPPGGGYLERSSSAFLPADLREIRPRRPRPLLERLDRRGLVPAPEVIARLRQVAERHRLDAGERSFGRRIGGTQEARQPGPASGFRGDEYARRGS